MACLEITKVPPSVQEKPETPASRVGSFVHIADLVRKVQENCLKNSGGREQ